MDSKQKYIRSKDLKRKFRPRNCTSSIKNNTNTVEDKDARLSDKSSEERENQFVPKQQIPKEGWFPEYDSSSSSDFEELDNLSKVFTNTLELETDKNWFEKELDNIKVNSDCTINEQNDKSWGKVPNQIMKLERETISNLKTSSAVKNAVKQSSETASSNDNDEELEFLLSLKEPLYTGPVIVQQNIENDRRFVLSNNPSNDKKPVKSIDLEKWLDSVLDD